MPSVYAGVELPEIIYETTSEHNDHIVVEKQGEHLKLRVNEVIQSINKESPLAEKLIWGQIVNLLKNEEPGMQNVLILGLGGGTVHHLLSKAQPGVNITTVELDNTMIDVAVKHFNVNSIPNLRVFNTDAFLFVVEPQSFGIKLNEFDVILVDIYCGAEFPDLGRSGSFFANLKRLTKPGGLIVFNRIYEAHHQESVNSFKDQVEEYLENVETKSVAGRTNADNVLIYGRT